MWGVFFCLFIFSLFLSRRELCLKYSKICYQFNLCAYYILYFSLYWSSLEHKSWISLFILLDFGPSLKSLLLWWWLEHHSLSCCWTEWVVSLFGLPCELYFFFFWSSIILPMITLCLLNRKRGVCQEGHSGSGEGRWGDYVSESQDWPPIVIFSSQSESWRFSNINSRIILLCHTVFEMETVSMKFIPQQIFLPPVPTEALPLWP